MVATTGTTASTALDPVGAIAAVAAKHNLWLHVDAAMAGSAMILPEWRWMWDGIERADSLVFNPHKWLGAVFDWHVLENLDLAVPFMVSGGLHAGNVAEAIRVTRAGGVDVSSGVERSPGHKDPEMIRAFIRAARATEELMVR